MSSVRRRISGSASWMGVPTERYVSPMTSSRRIASRTTSAGPCADIHASFSCGSSAPLLRPRRTNESALRSRAKVLEIGEEVEERIGGSRDEDLVTGIGEELEEPGVRLARARREGKPLDADVEAALAVGRRDGREGRW